MLTVDQNNSGRKGQITGGERNNDTREESDSIGTMQVPEKAYYGVQALRARNNFHITGRPLHTEFIRNLVRIKKRRP